MHAPHGNGTDTNAIAILALGSVYGDDCVAWHTADLLKSEARLAGIVKKIGSPWELIDFLSEDGRIIVLDACISGAPLGTLVQLGERDLAKFEDGGRSTHGGSISECFRLARALGRGINELVVLAVEINDRGGAEISHAGQEAVLRLEAAARRLLSRWGVME